MNLQGVILMLLGCCTLAQAQSLREAGPVRELQFAPPQVSAPERTASIPGKEIVVSDSLQQTITKLLVTQIPPEYENTKKWGGTKKVMSGLDWERDGLKIETRRQWKEVNHGSWSRYRLKLPQSEEEFQLRLENLRDVGNNMAECDVIIKGTMNCYGQLAEWRRGVQLFSISLEGDARVRLEAHVSMKLGLDPRTLPPDILVSPRITRAELVLEDLQLDRFGQASGPVVQNQLSKLLEHGVDEYLADYRDRLPEKMNKQLEKQGDKLRIPLSKLGTNSWSEWFSGYFQKTRENQSEANATP